MQMAQKQLRNWSLLEGRVRMQLREIHTIGSGQIHVVRIGAWGRIGGVVYFFLLFYFYFLF